MTFQPDSSQLKALKTWYPVDNPLHLNPRHAVIKLAGEAGEILDLYGKHEYKPNFSWWKCKVCGFMPAEKRRSEVDYFAYTCMNDKLHTPLILDELGDYSYYLRILAYQKEVSFEELCEGFNKYIDLYIENDILTMLHSLLDSSSQILGDYLDDTIIELGHLKYCAYYLQTILIKLNTALPQVLDLNYKKLNSEPTNHGWKNAKMKTIADCPPMNPK